MENYFSSNKNVFCVLGIIIFLIFFCSFLLSPPADFPSRTILRIESGESLRGVSLKLKNENIIRSRLVFEALAIILGGEKKVIRADYYFENRLPVYEVAWRVVKGEHHLAPVVVTIPEGFAAIQIADAFSSKLANFNKNKFLLEAQRLEGYLFPDTYFFLSTDNEVNVLKSMSENFNKKISVVRADIIKSGKQEKEIIIMASLVEGEAKGELDRGFIAGILWKRLSINMPLQVDAAPETYKIKGLPQSPINNPGMEAIKSAIYPQSSPYFYYLHDKNGKIHYARTFAEHARNISKYLK